VVAPPHGQRTAAASGRVEREAAEGSKTLAVDVVALWP